MGSFVRNIASSIARSFAGVLGRAGEKYLGPEMFTVGFAGMTTQGTGPPTLDANGIHFSGSSSSAVAIQTLASVNDVEWEVTFTVANRSAGGVRITVAGDTTNKAFVGTIRTANGTYTERGFTSGTSTTQDQIRVQATQTTTTLDVTALSVKRVLG